MNRKSISSNTTGLAYCLEDSDGLIPSEQTVPGVNVWNTLEPNSYGNFGASVNLVARMPISRDRQNKKGTVVGQTQAGDFQHDLTMSDDVRELLSGMFYANIRLKGRIPASASTADGFTTTSTAAAAIKAGDIVFASAAVPTANGGIHVAGAGSDAGNLAVTGLTVEGVPLTLTRVGFEFAAGDATIAATPGTLPQLETTTKDLTELGIIPGEIVYLGGDLSVNRFATSTNNGWARVLAVGPHAMVFDKSDFELGDDSGTGKSIRLFFGDVLKNETGNLITEKTYRFERTLGAPDRGQPNNVQAEYLHGATPGTVKITVPQSKIITADFAYTARDYTTRTAAEGPETGTRPVTVEQDAFNSAGDVKQIRLAVYPAVGGVLTSAPVDLFAIVDTLDVSLNNNLSENLAVGYVGAAEITEGQFAFTGTISAYFATVEAAQAIRDSADVTLHVCAFKHNKGIAIDFPMIGLGKGSATVAANKPIMLPVDTQMSTGKKYSPALDHTALFVFYDYLPTVAATKLL